MTSVGGGWQGDTGQRQELGLATTGDGTLGAQATSHTALPVAFYNRPALEVARDLLGMVLVRDRPDGTMAGRIVEVEAYDGPDDAASHARSGSNGRAASMFGPPGHAYVYLIYGIHHCLNLVTGPPGYPAAILLRALEPLEGISARTAGPGLICQALDIDRALNGIALQGPELWIEDRGLATPPERVVTRQRVGVAFAGEPWATLPWRFYEAENLHVSRR